MKLYALCLVFALSGCKAMSIPDKAFTQASDNAVLCDNFTELMDAGVTTREQEQAFIRANRRAWHAQNYALNSEPLPPDVQAWEARKKLGLESAVPLTDQQERDRRMPPR